VLSLPLGILLFVTIISNTAVNIFRGVYANRFGMSGNNLLRFNFIQNVACFIGVLLCFLSSGADFSFSLFSVSIGIVFALVNVVCLEAILKAQAIGAFAYTNVIVSLSAIIPTFSGLLFFDEKINSIQYMGIAFMVLCFLLSPDTSNENENSANEKWLIFCIIAFLASGATGVIQKIHQTSNSHKNEMATLLLTCFSCSSLFSGIKYYFCPEKYEGGNKSERINHYFWPIVAGICYSFAHCINLLLSGKLSAVVFFPTVNLCPMILTMLYAVLIYKEKLSLKRKAGIIIGIISTILVSGIITV